MSNKHITAVSALVFGLILSVSSLEEKRTADINIQGPRITTACIGIRLRNQMTSPFDIVRSYWHKFQKLKDVWVESTGVGNLAEGRERGECVGYELDVSETSNNIARIDNEPMIKVEATTVQTPSELDVSWEALKQTVLEFLRRSRRSYRPREWMKKQLAMHKSYLESKKTEGEYLKMVKWWLRNRP